MDKRKSWSALLSPLEWLTAAFQLLAAVFGPLLCWLGMLTPPSTEGLANIQKEDVDDAKNIAQEQEAAVDAIIREMSPAEVVRAYAKADPSGRATMDLSVLDFDQQDWLLRLSDEDLAKLAMSIPGGCARSLERKEVVPIYPKAQPEMESTEILRTPTEEDEEEWKREFVSARFRELFYAPGIPNPNAPYVPTTVH